MPPEYCWRKGSTKAAKLTVKMIFPIVVCYLPVFLIITLVPALLSIFHAL